MLLPKAPFTKAHTERLVCDGVFSLPLAPLRVSGVEVAALRGRGGLHDAALLDEAAEYIHLLTVALGRLLDGARSAQPLLLPGETTFDGPAENAWQFVAELRQKLLVLLGFRDAHHEGDEADAVPNCLVGPPNDRLVVGCEPELALRLEVEPLGPHEACGDHVASRHVLDERLPEALP